MTDLFDQAELEGYESGQNTLEAPSKIPVKTVSGELLSPKYSFETFVVGKSNQFAHASAEAVANRPGTYNPLFIVGKTGLGKTHLLKAIGYKIASEDQTKRICYLSTQRFIEEVISSIRKDARHELHEYYQNNCDIFLIDDIQFLARANSTQDEFFRIFNALFDAGKQIVITSDRHPSDISDVSDRIINRFQWGMIAEIYPPELETRVAILKSRAEANNINLSDEVAYLIGTYVKANVRELEGCLTKLAGHAAIYNVEISTELVKKVLQSYVSEKRRVVSIDDIIATVAQYYGFKPADLRGKTRKAPIAKSRQVVMYLAREVAMLSSSAVGQALGGRHHTTVLHGHEFIKSQILIDHSLKSQVDEIEGILLDKE